MHSNIWHIFDTKGMSAVSISSYFGPDSNDFMILIHLRVQQGRKVYLKNIFGVYHILVVPSQTPHHGMIFISSSYAVDGHMPISLGWYSCSKPIHILV